MGLIGEINRAIAPFYGDFMKRYLDVPFDDNHEVKRLGGQWDPLVKRWWIPEDRDTADFKKWLIRGQKVILAGANVSRFGESPKPLPEKNLDSPAYERFVSWWRWWNANFPTVEYRDHIGSFVRVGAIWRKP